MFHCHSVREKFFNHLEERNQEVLNHTVAVMDAKKEKLKSELDLRLHLHQPRAKRIEMDIHNVRAGAAYFCYVNIHFDYLKSCLFVNCVYGVPTDLLMHQDRVDRHCKGVLQALADFRTDFNNLQGIQQKKNDDFRAKIYSMEETLYTATKSDM